MTSDLIIGVVSGVIASIIVISMSEINKYIFRWKVEKCKIYDLEYIGERHVCAPPEYPRETMYIEPPHEQEISEEFYETLDVVRLQFSFDIKEIKIYEYEELVFPIESTEYLPAGEPIYIDCKCIMGRDEPAFVVKCKTFRHEYREYEYTTIYKYTGGFSRFGLKMVKQSICK